MNNLLKPLTVGGVFVAALGTVVFAFADFFAQNIHIVIWATGIVGSVVLSYLTSWSATEAYKRLHFSPHAWKTGPVKRKIYRCAMYSGAGCMLACGTIFLLLSSLTWQMIVVISVLWCLGSALIGMSSPLLWRWVFDLIIPKLNEWITGGGQCP